MSEDFVIGQHVIAQWQEGPGGKWWLKLNDAVFSTQDIISAFREWVDEGPPQKSEVDKIECVYCGASGFIEVMEGEYMHEEMCDNCQGTGELPWYGRSHRKQGREIMEENQPMDTHLTNLGQHLRQAAICLETRYSHAMDYKELCAVSKEVKQMREKLEVVSEEQWMRNLARILPETGGEDGEE